MELWIPPPPHQQETNVNAQTILKCSLFLFLFNVSVPHSKYLHISLKTIGYYLQANNSSINRWLIGALQLCAVLFASVSLQVSGQTQVKPAEDLLLFSYTGYIRVFTKGLARSLSLRHIQPLWGNVQSSVHVWQQLYFLDEHITSHKHS